MRLHVNYNGKDISDIVKSDGTSTTNVRAMAGEKLEADSAQIVIYANQVPEADASSAEAADLIRSLWDKNDAQLTDSSSMELYARGAAGGYQFPFERQIPVDISYDGNAIGRFYSKEMTADGVSGTITAYSAMWLLKLTRRNAQFYVNGFAGDALNDIFGDIPHTVDAGISDTVINGLIPSGTAYEQLFEVLLVTGAICNTQPDGSLRIMYPNADNVSLINEDRIFSNAKITAVSPPTYISLAFYDYVQSGETKEIWNGSVIGEMVVEFDKPHTAYTVTGATLVSSTYTSVTLRGNGSYTTISADSFTEITGEVSVGSPPTKTELDNVVSISGHRLVSSSIASSLVERLKKYYDTREKWSGKIIVHAEKAGDVVTIYRPDTKELVSACIQKMQYKFGLSNYFAQIEALVGFVPSSEDISGFKNHILLTGSGNFAVPSGVNAIYVVMVSGGNGGQAGFNGESNPASEITRSDIVMYAQIAEQEGAIGGAGGVGGVSGKIYFKMFSNIAAQTFSYSCGAGGNGGGTNGAEGLSGTPTIFGGYSTESGRVYPLGYTDKLTGIRFGAPCDGNGMAGSKGGNGGAWYERRWDEPTTGGYRRRYEIIATDGANGEYNNGLVGGNGGKGAAKQFTETWAEGIRANRQFVVGAGGGGGGACATTSGGKGGDGVCLGYSYNMYNQMWETGATAGVGGHGANATARPQAAIYGQGGAGGHGGGGAGGSGKTEVWFSTGYNNQTATIKQLESVGGNGGTGGKGGNGAILILY